MCFDAYTFRLTLDNLYIFIFSLAEKFNYLQNEKILFFFIFDMCIEPAL